MTSYRKKGWRDSKWIYIPLYPPIVAFRIARAVARSARESTRSAYKGTKKQIVRAQRQKINRQAATRDTAMQTGRPMVTERNRLQSYFLQLPLELRQQIYDDYFTPGTVILYESSAQDFRLSYTEESIRQHWIKLLASPGLQQFLPGKDLLNLSLVCQQIYFETVHYLYERHTFHIPNHLALAMPELKLFPRKHLDSLRSIELRFCFDVLAKNLKTAKLKSAPYCEKAINLWMAHVPGRSKERRKWLALWKLLAELPLLERLRVEFMWLPGPHQLTVDEFMWIVAPLLLFKRAKPLNNFDVVSSWVPEPPSPGWVKAIPYQLKWR